jgi:hypothetical protein
MTIDYPILEFDPEPEAILEPSRLIGRLDAPECCVVCFFAEVIQELVETGQARHIASSKS